MRTVDIERTAYPQLRPNITDAQVIEHYTLSETELSLVKGYKGDKLALAVRLRLTEHLLRSNFALSLVPSKVISYVADQQSIDKKELSETRATRYEQIQICRRFWGFSPFSEAEAKKLEAWLRYQRTPFYELKEPPESPTASAIQKEVGLLLSIVPSTFLSMFYSRSAGKRLNTFLRLLRAIRAMNWLIFYLRRAIQYCSASSTCG